MKIWIDDIRPAPEGYIWCKSTREALRFMWQHGDEIEMIDLDHDAGSLAVDGGDFINVLKELERLSNWKLIVNGAEVQCNWHDRCKKIKFRLHSMNPVGVQNMRTIIQHNGWTEIE